MKNRKIISNSYECSGPTLRLTPFKTPFRARVSNVTFLVVLHLLICSAVGNGAALHIVGIAEHKEVISGRTKIVPFSIDVHNCKWRLRVKPFDFVDYVEVSCDGESTYYFCWMKTEVDRKRVSGEEVGFNSGTAIIRKSPVPSFPSLDASGAIWLTYASGCYFSSPRIDAEPPGCEGVLSGNPLPFEKYITERVIFSRGRNFLGVPQEVIYLDDGTSKLTHELEPAPFDKGFTNIEFKALSYTNFADKLFPLQTVTKTFAIRKNKSGATLRVLYQDTITTTNIVEIPDLSDPRSAINGPTLFSEERFNRNVGGFQFSYASTRWLSESEATNLPEYSQALKYSSRLRSIEVKPPDMLSSFRRNVVLAFMAITFGLPTIILLKRRNQLRN